MEDHAVRRAGYSYTLVNIDCLPTSDHFNIVLTLDEPIEALLPYLAAELPGCTYTHGTGVINCMDAGHIVAIHPQLITITDVGSPEEAEALCARYTGLIERVSANREAITPVFSRKSSVSVLGIFRELPKTNCGQCGAASCMAFAAQVFRRESPITACLPLMDDRVRHAGFFADLDANGYPTHGR